MNGIDLLKLVAFCRLRQRVQNLCSLVHGLHVADLKFGQGFPYGVKRLTYGLGRVKGVEAVADELATSL